MIPTSVILIIKNNRPIGMRDTITKGFITSFMKSAMEKLIIIFIKYILMAIYKISRIHFMRRTIVGGNPSNKNI